MLFSAVDVTNLCANIIRKTISQDLDGAGVTDDKKVAGDISREVVAEVTPRGITVDTIQKICASEQVC